MKNSMQINGTLWVKKTSNREPLNGLPEGCWKAVPSGSDWKEILIIQRSAIHRTKWVFQRYRFNGSQWVAFNRSKDSLTMLVSDRKLSVMFEYGSIMLKREEATATATPEPVPPVAAVPVVAVEPTPEAVAELPPVGCWFTYAGTIGSNGERMTEEEKSEAVRKLRVEHGITAHLENFCWKTVICVRVVRGVGLPQWFYRSFDLLGRGIPGDLQPVSVVR